MVLTTDARNGYVTNYIGTVIGGECTVDITEVSPVGQILPYAGPTGTIPKQHILCDGSVYVTGQENELFNVIGYTYGMSGTDVNTFRVPDLQGRFPLGANTGPVSSGLMKTNPGASGGTELFTIGTDGAAILGTGPNQTYALTGNNMPPYLALNFIIRRTKQANAVINCEKNPGGFTNKLINGNFDFWQRGSAFNATGGISGNQSFYTTDRWVNQVQWDDNNTKEWKGGVNKGLFMDGQLDVPYYPRVYARIQSYLTGAEGAAAAYNMNHEGHGHGSTLGITDKSPNPRETNVVGGILSTADPVEFPYGLGRAGAKGSSTKYGRTYGSTSSYCVGTSYASNLQEDYTSVAGPFDFSRKDQLFPANSREFTIEGWFKLLSGPNRLTGAVTGGTCTGGGGHAPITLLRFGAPPSTGCEFTDGGMTFDGVSGIDGRRHTSIQLIASDDDTWYDPTPNAGSVTGPLYAVAQWNTGGAESVPTVVTGYTNINDNEWHHIAFARNNTCNEFKLFVDGVCEGIKSASGNDPIGLIVGSTGGTGGVSGDFLTGSTGNYNHGDMYIFGALDLDNAATTGSYCADLIKVRFDIDASVTGDCTTVTGSDVTGPFHGFYGGGTGGTGGTGGSSFRNFVAGGADDDGYGYCAFSQRIEDVTTFASNVDESVTLTFWARGMPGPSPNGDIHVNLKQCFGSNIPLITGVNEAVLGNEVRTINTTTTSKFNTSLSFSAGKGGKAFANTAPAGKQSNIEFDAFVISSKESNTSFGVTNYPDKRGSRGGQSQCGVCDENCFDCQSYDVNCYGCQCCTKCYDTSSSNCRDCADEACGGIVCPEAICCLPGTADCRRTTCEDCRSMGGIWTGIDGSCVEGQKYCQNNYGASFDSTSGGDGPVVAPLGSCCGCSLGINGCATNIVEADCDRFDGTWTQDGKCDHTMNTTGPCVVEYGACCVSGGTTTHAAYRLSGGTVYIGNNCGDGGIECVGQWFHHSWTKSPTKEEAKALCMSATGACCAGGACTGQHSMGHCTGTLNGVFLGFRVPCEGTDCSTGGACCTWDGTCVDYINEADCTAVSGTWHGTGTLCTTFAQHCTGYGTCCNQYDEECTEVVSGTSPEENCAGIWQLGEHCSSVLCSRGGGGDLITGACCINGVAYITGEGDCYAGGGKWFGEESTELDTACCRVIPGQRISLSPEWKKYTLHFTIPHIMGIPIGSRKNDYLELNFFTYADRNAGVENQLDGYTNMVDGDEQPLPCNYPHEWNVAQVQLEKGAAASEFEQRTQQTERELCERYFEVRRNYGFTTYKHITGNEDHGTTGTEYKVRNYVPFEVEKLFFRPEIFMFNTADQTHRLTGFSVRHRTADGFLFTADYQTGSAAGNAQLTGNYFAVSELYTPQEELQLGYDFYATGEGGE
ncbi:MAG: hypothetical protein CMM25_08925 [Rhodospirillaceae bacterium]|nr:hypothetical protein [Rhodospirillaceae bacterium]